MAVLDEFLIYMDSVLTPDASQRLIEWISEDKQLEDMAPEERTAQLVRDAYIQGAFDMLTGNINNLSVQLGTADGTTPFYLLKHKKRPLTEAP